MKTWLLVDSEDGEPRDIWDDREMTIAEAQLRAGRTAPDVKVWLHRDILLGTFEAAIGTREEVEELWPDGLLCLEKYKRSPDDEFLGKLGTFGGEES